MMNWRLGSILTITLTCFFQSYSAIGQTEIKCRPTSPLYLLPARVVTQGFIDTKIYHDPDADFKQRRGQIHNRTYLKKKLAPLNLNVDSLQNVVEILNRDTRDKEWEYQISTIKGSSGQILRFYKSHNNPDGSSGRTIYGEEKRRMPER